MDSELRAGLQALHCAAMPGHRYQKAKKKCWSNIRGVSALTCTLMLREGRGVGGVGESEGVSEGEVGGRAVSYTCNCGSALLYVGQPMSANKSNYHQPLRENKP